MIQEKKFYPKMASHCIFISTTLIDHSISNYFKGLAESLAQSGNEVVLISDGRKYSLVDEKSNPRIFTWPSSRPTRLSDAAFFLKLLKRYRPECLVANFGSVNVNLLCGWLRRIPVRVAWCHTLTSQLNTDTRHPAWLEALYRFRKKQVYRFATHFACNTLATREDLHKQYGVATDRCAVFNYLIPDPAKGFESLEKIPGRVVCVGRLFPSKGQDVLIDAIPGVLSVVPNAVFEFIGDGPSAETYRRRAEGLGVADRCHFRGRLPLREAERAMAVAEVAVAPSRSEALGLVNVEALGTGTPVVSSAVDGIKEIVRDNVDGYLVASENSEQLAKKIVHLLTEPALRKQFGQNARNRFLEKFCQEKLVKSHADWYVDLITHVKKTCCSR